MIGQDSQYIKITVESTTFEVKRDQLMPEIDQTQKKTIQDKLILPPWTSAQVFSLLLTYINFKDFNLYKDYSNDTQLLIQTLRITDYLGMYKFQQKFISDIVTPAISISNCVAFLQETHRKLKNQQNGSQCWYSLLNANISFLAIHLKQVYRISSEKLKKLHEKILNEILDRAIRNGNVDEQMIFELVMQSRKVNSVQNLCQILRTNIQNKKINPKIHAKLSWKLHDVLSIKDKKTKNFKFLDFDWLLQATRTKDNELAVKLTFCGLEERVQIGAFYLKLMWWIEGKAEQKRQQKMKINYILMNKREQLSVLNLSEELQNELGKSKIQLSIFCCMDQIYTFTLNYLSKYHEKIHIEERKLTPEQLLIIIVLLKERKQYSSSIRFMKYLAFLRKDVPQELFNDYPLSQLTPYQIDFLQKMYSQKLVPSDLSSQSSEISDIRSLQSQSRRSQQRPQSKGRLRKIFASSPNKSVNDNTLRIQDINRISNLKTYFYDKTSPLYNQL